MKIEKLLFFASLLLPYGLLAQFTAQDPNFPEHYEISYIHAVSESVVWITATDNSGNNHAPMFSVTETGGNTWQSVYIVSQQNLATGMIFGFDIFPVALAAVSIISRQVPNFRVFNLPMPLSCKLLWINAIGDLIVTDQDSDNSNDDSKMRIRGYHKPDINKSI